ncbi:MAG TPA: kelch repeat-containing protein [Polyangiaceae bacterium]|nr:kelch repeat-containing protein [Polyangiaceae bacterium]
MASLALRGVALGASWVAPLAVNLACSASDAVPPELARRTAALEAVQFTPISNSTLPNARSHAGFVYDPAIDGSVAFGGHLPSDATLQGLRDTWVWDGVRWNSPPAGYPQRSFVSGIYDPSSGKLLSYGGYAATAYNNDTWEFDGLNWSSRFNLLTPGKRSSYGMAHDSSRGVTVLFGGYNGQWQGDIWEWDGTLWTERCTNSPCSTSPKPSARANATFVYDEARKVTLLFGGYGPGGSRSDTWLWNGSQFVLVKTAIMPSPRDSAAATYDPVTQRVLLFGGIQSDGVEQNDLWAWDGVQWQSIAQSTPATPRQGAGLAWDSKRRRGVLVGGEFLGKPVEPWEFTVSGNRCSSDLDCHQSSCLSGICASVSTNSGSGGSADPGAGGESANGGAAGDGGAGGATNESRGGNPTGAGGSLATSPTSEGATSGRAGSGGSGGSGSSGAGTQGGHAGSGSPMVQAGADSGGAGRDTGTEGTLAVVPSAAEDAVNFYACSVIGVAHGSPLDSRVCLSALAVGLLLVERRRRRHKP